MAATSHKLSSASSTLYPPSPGLPGPQLPGMWSRSRHRLRVHTTPRPLGLQTPCPVQRGVREGRPGGTTHRAGPPQRPHFQGTAVPLCLHPLPGPLLFPSISSVTELSGSLISELWPGPLGPLPRAVNACFPGPPPHPQPGPCHRSARLPLHLPPWDCTTQLPAWPLTVILGSQWGQGHFEWAAGLPGSEIPLA